MLLLKSDATLVVFLSLWTSIGCAHRRRMIWLSTAYGIVSAKMFSLVRRKFMFANTLPFTVNKEIVSNERVLVRVCSFSPGRSKGYIGMN